MADSTAPGVRLPGLACLGGTPRFSRPRSIGQLHRPDLAAFLVRLREIAADGRYSGNLAMVENLEARLAELHETRHCVAVANAGLGLTLLLRLLAGGRHGEVILPAFSYRGLPHFAQWAGQHPVFCDVDPARHTLCPVATAAAIGPRTTAVLAVCNANSAPDIAALERITVEHDIPLLFDSVYGIGATHGGVPLGRFGQAEVFSLHATKLLNGFEGGYVTTDDDALADALRRERTGGPGTLGLNATLNEVHAAMALGSLEDLSTIIADNQERYETYRALLDPLPGLKVLPCPHDPGERSNYELVLIEVGGRWPLTRDQTVTLLQAENARITAYYSPALHRSEHGPPDFAPPHLPVAEGLAGRLLQLPVGNRTSLADVHAIGEILRRASEYGPVLRRALEKGA